VIAAFEKLCATLAGYTNQHLQCRFSIHSIPNGRAAESFFKPVAEIRVTAQVGRVANKHWRA